MIRGGFLYCTGNKGYIMIVGDKWAGLLDELLAEASETREPVPGSVPAGRVLPSPGPGPYVRLAERTMSGGAPEWAEGVEVYRVPVLVTGQALMPDEAHALNDRYRYGASARGRYLRLDRCIVAAVPWYPNRNRGGYYGRELERIVGEVSAVYLGEPFHAAPGPWQSFRGRACLPVLPAGFSLVTWAKWNLCGPAEPFPLE